VVALLNVRYRPGVITTADTEAVALVAAPEALDAARTALAAMARPPALLVLDGPECRLVASGRVEPVAAAPAADSPPLLQQYTSGSTGAPKRVVRTHAHLGFELRAAWRRSSRSAKTTASRRALLARERPRPRADLDVRRRDALPDAEFHRRRALARHARAPDVLRRRATMFVVLADTPVRGTVDLSSLRTVFSAARRSSPTTTGGSRRSTGTGSGSSTARPRPGRSA
jgi:acyl-CoA synthetase (AMP-forming)/AMP-acid ligase II